MGHNYEHGLGELLRHVTELIDRSSESFYKKQKMQYRPRFTPIMRVLAHGPRSVNDITEQLAITQGAVSQTLKIMESEKLIKRSSGVDSRQYFISLTKKGQGLLSKLENHWQMMFDAAELLEEEIEAPLRNILLKTIRALEKKEFSERVMDAMRMKK